MATGRRDCFAALAACGYPDPGAGTVGAPCASLPRLDPARPPAGTRVLGSGLLQVVRPYTTLRDLALTAGMGIQVAASHATLDRLCVLSDGGGASGSTAVQIARGMVGTLIERSTLGGANASGGATDQAITNDADNPDTTARADLLVNCGECLHGTWTLLDSYVDASATIRSEHYEDWYFSDGTILARHDVFENPHEQTATIFGDTAGGGGGPGRNHITVTDSLLAGGGFLIYADSSATGVGTSTIDIEHNHFARCDGRSAYDATTGGTACRGGTGAGFWPRGGYFGVSSQIFCGRGQRWLDNVWDDTGQSVGCGG